MKPIHVRYIGTSYASWFGKQTYVATPKHVRGASKTPVRYEIVDPDGDLYTVAKGALHDGLQPNWIIVPDEPTNHTN